MADNLFVVGIGGTLREYSTNRIALEHALDAARRSGASVELLDLNVLQLPMYLPDPDLDAFGANVQYFVETAARAHAMIWSTGAYHGTLAGVTKNAIDFLEFLQPMRYLDNKPVGLIATSGSGIGDASNAINAMLHAVHALRGITPSYSVPLPSAKAVIKADGTITDARTARRLERLGEMVVDLAHKINSELQLEQLSVTP